jgi:uncharacterized Zn-finger protein
MLLIEGKRISLRSFISCSNMNILGLLFFPSTQLVYSVSYTLYCSIHYMFRLSGSRELNFSCDVCKISFTSRYKLDRHARVHTEEMPFSCEVCKKRFSLRSNLIVHLRVHTGERSFLCEVCKKHFALRSGL